MPRALRAITAVMLLLFVLAVAVQYNDPDPLRWMVVYGGAAVACLLALRGRLPAWLPVLIGGLALAWAVTLLPNVWGHVRVGELFRDIRMDSATIEEGREAVGLLIVAFYMAIVFFASSTRQPRKSRGKQR